MANENCPECGPQGGTGWVELAFDRVPCSLCGPKSEVAETTVEPAQPSDGISHHVHADVKLGPPDPGFTFATTHVHGEWLKPGTYESVGKPPPPQAVRDLINNPPAGADVARIVREFSGVYDLRGTAQKRERGATRVQCSGDTVRVSSSEGSYSFSLPDGCKHVGGLRFETLDAHACRTLVERLVGVTARSAVWVQGVGWEDAYKYDSKRPARSGCSDPDRVYVVYGTDTEQPAQASDGEAIVHTPASSERRARDREAVEQAVDTHEPRSLADLFRAAVAADTGYLYSKRYPELAAVHASPPEPQAYEIDLDCLDRNADTVYEAGVAIDDLHLDCKVHGHCSRVPLSQLRAELREAIEPILRKHLTTPKQYGRQQAKKSRFGPSILGKALPSLWAYRRISGVGGSSLGTATLERLKASVDRMGLFVHDEVVLEQPKVAIVGETYAQARKHRETHYAARDDIALFSDRESPGALRGHRFDRVVYVGRVKQHTLDTARHCLNVGGELVDGRTEKTTEEIIADVERLIADISQARTNEVHPPALLLPIAPSAVEQGERVHKAPEQQFANRHSIGIEIGIKRTEVKPQRSEDGKIEVT